MIRTRIRHTDHDAATAWWQLAPGGAARILRLEIRDERGQARTVPFDSATDLAAARERLPEYSALWDRVRDERAAAVLDPGELPAGTDPVR